MEYVEIDYEYLYQTDDAVLISDGDDEHWIPKSCIENGNRIAFELNNVMSIEEWFAIKRGLV